MGYHSDMALAHFMRGVMWPSKKAKKAPRIIRCKYCNKNNLRWKNVPGGGGSWGLYESDGDTRHMCSGDGNTGIPIFLKS